MDVAEGIYEYIWVEDADCWSLGRCDQKRDYGRSHYLPTESPGLQQ